MAETNIAGERCETCRFWPLSPYSQRNSEIRPLSGEGGHHADGSVSRCLRNAPMGFDNSRYPLDTALWPTTKRNDFCGEHQPRPTPRESI